MDKMPESFNSWEEYGRFVIKELERLNTNYESLRKDLDYKLNELNDKISEIQGVERTVNDQKVWIERVNDIWSPTQMKEAKDEIYKQKNRWTAAMAILVFLQVLIGFLLSIVNKFF